MTRSLPIGGVAMVILIIFLHLPTEKQNLRVKLKRIDYAGNNDKWIGWRVHAWMALTVKARQLSRLGRCHAFPFGNELWRPDVPLEVGCCYCSYRSICADVQ